MSSSQEKLYQIALTLVPKIGDVTVRQLISYCGSAEEVFKTPTGKLLKIPNIGNTIAKNLQDKSVMEEAWNIMRSADEKEIDLLFYTDKDFPNRLKTIYDAPVLLYFKGNTDLNAQRVISIVGTRQATDYGKRMVEEIIEGFKSYNVLIVSGLAYGIDIAAHRCAIKNQVPNVGVMASGADLIYPQQHKQVAQQMIENGGVLTEYKIGTEPDPRFFPLRNRIIAGMADALIVVETASKGGTLISAEYANNYHKDVFAVPGQVGKPFSEGCNNLIKNNKAQIYTGVNDVVEALNWDLDGTSTKSKTKESTLDLSKFTEEESAVLSLLRKNQEMQIDDLAWQSQIQMGKLSSLLLSLEFQGIIKSMPGKKYGLGYIS